MHILLPKQSNFKISGQFENLGFVIMSTRENIRLIARAPLTCGLATDTLANSDYPKQWHFISVFSVKKGTSIHQ